MIDDFLDKVIIGFFTFLTGIVIGISMIKPKNLESKEILIPYKKLVIVDNKVDTIYQYKLKK